MAFLVHAGVRFGKMDYPYLDGECSESRQSNLPLLEAAPRHQLQHAVAAREGDMTVAGARPQSIGQKSLKRCTSTKDDQCWLHLLTKKADTPVDF